MNRRRFLQLAGAGALQAAVGSSPFSHAAHAARGPGPYGPLQAPDANGLMLPAGFRSRIVARGERPVPGTHHVWHAAADGGACFRAEGGGHPPGYVYVSNAEIDGGRGGVGAIRFDQDGNVVDAYAICSGTSRNCAGGSTPWNTWLSCEEVEHGRVHECDPLGVAAPVVRPALGRFKHEAVAADPVGRRLYLTEDRHDGLLYRFTPATWGDLSAGVLEAALVTGGRVGWERVPDPDGDPTPTRDQVPGATTFARGEGIAWANGHVYFATTADDRVWDLDIAAGTLGVLYQRSLDPSAQLAEPDNVGVSPAGGVVVAEDADNLEVVLLTPDGVAAPIVRITGQWLTEVTGPAFEPLGRRLYLSSQRGGRAGITYEVEGPFRADARSAP